MTASSRRPSASFDADVSTGNQKRQASVYDAVAGRVSSTGFIPTIPFASKNRDTLSSTSLPAPPDEVLFRRKGAPERYQEDDFYWADRNLTPDRQLPDSDLLKAIHTYASDFYSRATVDGGKGDFHSMDETALLAIAILLEESAKQSLGDTGDLVFVEGENDTLETDTGNMDGPFSDARRRVRSSSSAARKSGQTREAKRRRLNQGSDAH
ncbi:hypothetical protein MMC08_008350 [Hypocenomyce scalaris]|nr:hypothetical protein [Hypocenomyce scalaris]